MCLLTRLRDHARCQLQRRRREIIEPSRKRWVRGRGMREHRRGGTTWALAAAGIRARIFVRAGAFVIKSGLQPVPSRASFVLLRVLCGESPAPAGCLLTPSRNLSPPGQPPPAPAQPLSRPWASFPGLHVHRLKHPSLVGPRIGQPPPECLGV